MEFICPFCKETLPYIPNEEESYCMLCGAKVFTKENNSPHNNNKTLHPHNE